MVNYLNHFKTLVTKGYHGHSIQFSSAYKHILAVAGAENFGIKGGGCLIIFDFNALDPIHRRYRYCDAIFDLSWSKRNPDLILTGSGDGCVQMWLISETSEMPRSCRNLHAKEVSSVEFTTFDLEYFTSSSWDSTIYVSAVNSVTPLCILRNEGNAMVYEAKWSNIRQRTMASVSSNGKTMLWSPFSSQTPDLILPDVGAEVLSVDWSHSNSHTLVTGCTNAIVYVWDLRSPNIPVYEMRGHENAVRKVRFSPFSTNELASVSYDFTTRLWDTATGLEISATRNHSEFVYDVDYSNIIPGVAADCSWDQTIQLYRVGPPQHERPIPLSAIENKSNFPNAGGSSSNLDAGASFTPSRNNPRFQYKQTRPLPQEPCLPNTLTRAGFDIHPMQPLMPQQSHRFGPNTPPPRVPEKQISKPLPPLPKF